MKKTVIANHLAKSIKENGLVLCKNQVISTLANISISKLCYQTENNCSASQSNKQLDMQLVLKKTLLNYNAFMPNNCIIFYQLA